MPRPLITDYALRITHYGLLKCFLTAFLLILSFPVFNFEFLAWFAFVPLFIILRRVSPTQGFILSLFTGVIFWLGIIYWLIHVTLPGMIILVLYCALYFAAFGFLITRYSLLNTRYAFIVIPAIWCLLEYSRTILFTGFPWALLGYSQYRVLPLIQISDLTGVWGVSFLVMLVNVSLYGGCARIKKLIPAFACVVLALAYGYARISQLPHEPTYPPLEVSIVQGNIPQELKWDPRMRDFTVDKYLRMSRQALATTPDFLIWPEAAMPVILEEEPFLFEQIRNFVREIDIPLLFGVVTSVNGSYYNSALLVAPEDNFVERYNKVHLVPFGEYIPLRETLPFLETVVPIGDFTAGRDHTVFSKPIPFSVLICFEDLFPDLSRASVNNGARLLINITNDAWFQKTSSPFQHLQASVFRAVENRVHVIRAANTGISCVIGPSGGIISMVENEEGEGRFVSGAITQEIKPLKEKSGLYSRIGDGFIMLCCFVVLLPILAAPYARQRRKLPQGAP